MFKDTEKVKSDSDTESSVGLKRRRVVFSTDEEDDQSSQESESEKGDSGMNSSVFYSATCTLSLQNH